MTRTFRYSLRRVIFVSFCFLLIVAVAIVGRNFPSLHLDIREAVVEITSKIETRFPYYGRINDSTHRTDTRPSDSHEVKVDRITDGDAFKAEIKIQRDIGEVVVESASKTETRLPYYGRINDSTHRTDTRPSDSHEVRVIRIIDGDTFKAEIEAQFGGFELHSVRLRGIDAPERRDRDTCEYARRLYEQSERRLKQLAGSRVVLRNTEIGYYGRIIADVYTLQGINIAETLLREGLVRVYQRPKDRPSWC